MTDLLNTVLAFGIYWLFTVVVIIFLTMLVRGIRRLKRRRS